MYEKLYDDIYGQREDILMDKMSKEQITDLVNEFNNKAKLYELDADFKKLVVDPFDIKDTLKQNKEAGIANFWQRAMINHPNIS